MGPGKLANQQYNHGQGCTNYVRVTTRSKHRKNKQKGAEELRDQADKVHYSYKRGYLLRNERPFKDNTRL